MPRVNPDVLKWARETAGLSLEAAAKAIQLNDARGVSGADRLAALEAGDELPSRTILSRMAEKYRRPLVAFYVNERPPAGDRGEDFRHVPNAPPEFNPQLDALIRNVRARHDLVTALLEDEEAEPVDFIGSCRMAEGVPSVAGKICTQIGFDLAEFRRARTADLAFAYLRDRLERSGIFVLLLGNLGSHHSNIEARVFRGYAIANRLAPFIVINDNDARAAWSFTALHEAAHLWLGQTGVSGASHEARIERFCNDVAGFILLPPAELVAFEADDLSSFEAALASITKFAEQRNVSRRMVAYLLLQDHKISSARYVDLADHFHGLWLRIRQRERENADEGRGPHRYVVLRHRLGPALVGLARRNLDAGDLSPLKASRLLGVNPGAVRSFLHPGGAR